MHASARIFIGQDVDIERTRLTIKRIAGVGRAARVRNSRVPSLFVRVVGHSDADLATIVLDIQRVPGVVHILVSTINRKE